MEKPIRKRSTKKSSDEAPFLYSYWDHRTIVGILGVALPIVLPLGGLIIFQTGIQDSISNYYHTGMRDVYVGIHWAIAIFLLSYKGYEQIDDTVGNWACLFAIGVTLFPTFPSQKSPDYLEWVGYVHLFFAALFFFALIYFSFCLFTKTDPNKLPTPGKLQRNKVYKVCAYIMAICILLIAIIFLLPDNGFLKNIHPVFWLEALAVWAFGVSWFTKGKEIQEIFPFLQ